VKQPNIILIFVDNQPADMMGCSGNDEIHTPNLDVLAAKGMRFDQAYCPNAMCSPCRASVLTGLIPSQHGIHTWLDDSKMDAWPKGWNALAEFDTLPERLIRAGYDTALVGKYHLGFPDVPQNDFSYWVTMDSIPREGVSKELIDWIMLRHDKLPEEDKDFYRSLPRLLNDLPTLRNYYSGNSKGHTLV
jgi:arylsulfatase A-like enzyme